MSVSTSSSSPPSRPLPSPLPTSWLFTCIGVLSRRCWPMRTRNRTQTAGVRKALGDKKVGRSSRSQIWNLRLELGHQLHPTAMRLTEFAEASSPPPENTSVSPPAAPTYGPPTFAKTWKRDRLEGHDFAPQPDGTLRCPTDHPLYPQERREAARWDPACGVCSPHWPLPSLSIA